jgi:hypothetical protein
VGLVDGNVAVLNLEKDEDNETQSQVMKNIPIEIKHRAPVWSVKWAADDIDGNPIFFSAGMGGRVIQWTLDVPDLNGNGGLVGTPIATLTLPKSQVSGPDGTTIKLFGRYTLAPALQHSKERAAMNYECCPQAVPESSPSIPLKRPTSSWGLLRERFSEPRLFTEVVLDRYDA